MLSSCVSPGALHPAAAAGAGATAQRHPTCHPTAGSSGRALRTATELRAAFQPHPCHAARTAARAPLAHRRERAPVRQPSATAHGFAPPEKWRIRGVVRRVSKNARAKRRQPRGRRCHGASKRATSTSPRRPRIACGRGRTDSTAARATRTSGAGRARPARAGQARSRTARPRRAECASTTPQSTQHELSCQAPATAQGRRRARRGLAGTREPRWRRSSETSECRRVDNVLETARAVRDGGDRLATQRRVPQLREVALH